MNISGQLPVYTPSSTEDGQSDGGHQSHHSTASLPSQYGPTSSPLSAPSPGVNIRRSSSAEVVPAPKTLMAPRNHGHRPNSISSSMFAMSPVDEDEDGAGEHSGSRPGMGNNSQFVEAELLRGVCESAFRFGFGLSVPLKCFWGSSK